MRTTSVAAVVALMMLAPATGSHLPAAIAQHDPDGGTSLRLLIDDARGGTYDYTRADITASKNLAAAFLSGLNHPVTNTVANGLRDVDAPITELGAYTHSWTRAGAPMLTVGMYAVHQTAGMHRVPLVILENIAATTDVSPLLMQLVLNEAGDFVTQVVPFITEMALVDSTFQFQTYPPFSSVDSFRDYPTIYAWTVHKQEGGRDIWQGFYLARIGGAGGATSGPGSYDAHKRMDIGVALRIDGNTQRAAGMYIETTLERQATSTSQHAGYRFTLGSYSDAAGSVPLATIDADDDRMDANGDLFGEPQEQATRMSFGTWANGDYVPLLGMETIATHRKYTCPEQPADQPNRITACIEQERITSLGTFVDGAYLPLAGLRYHGERMPLVAWSTVWLNGGGPGAQNAGDFEIDIGTFLDGDFVPLAGAHYDDSFSDARRVFQMMISVGTHTPLGFQPLAAVTYDGDLPLVTTAPGLTQDNRNRAVPWMTSAGTFALDRYVPLIGVRYLPVAEDGQYGHQHQIAIGTFLADYHLFVPLVGAQWDGVQGPVQWSVDAALGGGLGAAAGAVDVNGGVFVLGTYHHVVGIESRDDYDSTEGEHAAEQSIVAGTYGLDGSFVPLVGVMYASEDDLVGAVGAANSFDDDDPLRVTAGIFVAGEFTPVVGATHEGPETSLTVLPSAY